MSLAESILGSSGEVARRITKIGDHRGRPPFSFDLSFDYLASSLDLGIRFVDAEQEQVVSPQTPSFLRPFFVGAKFSFIRLLRK